MLQTAGRILSLQEGLALKQQREIAAQKALEDQAETAAMMDAYGKVGPNVDELRKRMAGKVSAQKQEALYQTIAETQDKYLTADAKTRKAWDDSVTHAASATADLLGKSDEEIQKQWPSVYDSSIAVGIPAETLTKMGLTRDAAPSKTLLKVINNHAIGSEKVFAEARAQDEAKAKAAAAELKGQLDLAQDFRAQQASDATLPGTRAKAEQEELQTASTKLGAARTVEDYQKARGELPYRIASQFPDKWDAKTTPAQVRDLGMTPKDQAAEAKPVKEEAPTEARMATTVATGRQPGATPEQVNAANINEAALKIMKNQRVGGANRSNQANTNRQVTRIDSLQKTEDATRSERSRLESAIAGNVYFDRLGNIKDFTEAKSDAEKASWSADMKTRYTEETNKLRNVTREKNQIGKQLGADISVSTDEIHWNLEKDEARVLGKPTSRVLINTPSGPMLLPRTNLQAALAKGATLLDDGGVRVK